MSEDSRMVFEKKLNRIAWAVSVAVFLLIVLMRRFKISINADVSFLPFVYSTINFITAILLLFGYYLIRIKKHIALHQRIMTICILLSISFLIMYVLYHITTEETLYCGQGAIRILYFFILISHVVLASLILPFILFTYIRAITQQFVRHKRMARWVFPVWFYVAITGPAIYLLLLPCY